MMNALDISKLSYTYPDRTQALKYLSLQVERGRRTALLGANGSGKTTLLYHLNGLLMPQQGQVHVMGYAVTAKNIMDIRKKAGLLFDNPDNQLFSTTVFNDVAFGPRNLGLDETTVKDRVEKAMSLVGVTSLARRPPYNLSLGQKKKVALAGILSMEPELLLLDEPFSGLDPGSTREILKIMKQLNEGNCTLIISTHDVDMVYAWANEVVILDQGRILEKGSVELLRDVDLMERAGLDVPILATSFQGTGMHPRTAHEANHMLKITDKCS